jgi:hypothetical protein
MGYTPAFDSIYTGTLYGKWPTAAVWASLLPLVDVRGEINLTPEAIAGMTGWPLDLLRAGLAELCEPDMRSRSKAEDGRRLVLIDPTRDWGWRVVNVSLYRAKAAGLNQVADGRNAEKVRRYKERHRQTPPGTNGHHDKPETPHSDSDSDSDSDKDKNPLTPKGGTAADKKLHGQVLAAYHELLPELPAVRDWSERRRRKLAARIAERVKAGKPADQVSYWRSLFTQVHASDFLCGRKSDWRCPGLEWILEPKNFTKVIEGAYRNNDGMNGHAR